jgi:hypothetical protein
MDVSLAGNSYTVRQGSKLTRLRPDWTDIVLTRPEGDPEAETAGYLYYPGGKRKDGRDALHSRAEVVLTAALPKPPAAPGEEAEDPRAELVRRLLEYEVTHEPSFVAVDALTERLLLLATPREALATPAPASMSRRPMLAPDPFARR